MRFELLHPADQLVMIMNRIYYYGMTTTSGGNLSIMDEDGNIWHRDTFTYENGKLMLRVVFSNGEESFREEYTYNAAGQPTEKRSFDEGHLHGRTVYTYENGSLVNLKLYDHEELEGEYTFSYKKANVSAEQAEKLLALYESMEFD